MTSGPPAAGWYSDPHDPSRQRYWDGSRWTDQTAPMAASAAPTGAQPWQYAGPEPKKGNTGLIVGGWVAAFLFPLAGLVLGIILLTRQEQAHGIAITALSSLFLVGGIILIAASGGSAAAV